MVDTLRVESNERIDLTDFDDLIHGLRVDGQRELPDNFLTSPDSAVSRSWVIDGFEIDNPAASQVRVTLGRAILPYRVAGEIKYGMLAVDGDAEKIIDIAAYAAGTYGIYLRFNFADGTEQSRVFWDASATAEFAQTIETRRIATWEMRIESGAPGADWFQIGEVDQATMTITDQRLLYFEGNPDGVTAYESGWSSDGGTGGAATDRNADRGIYGVKDLQRFTAAMRQCLEDIKGRGLRRWWERDIGGMNIGFDADPVAGHLAIGSDEYYLADVGGFPTMMFVDADDDVLYYDTAADVLTVEIAGVVCHQWADDYYGLGPAANFGLLYNAGVAPAIYFAGVGDAMKYVRGADEFQWDIAAVNIATLDEVCLQLTGGLVAGDAAMAIAGNITSILLVDANCGLVNNGAIPYLKLDANDDLRYTRASNTFGFVVGGFTVANMADAGLAINKGLYVGNSAGVPLDDDIVADGGIRCGAGYATNPGDGEAIFKTGISVGYDGAPAGTGLTFSATDYTDYAAGVFSFLFAAGVGLDIQGGRIAPNALGACVLGDTTDPFTGLTSYLVRAYGSGSELKLWDTGPASADQEKFVIRQDTNDVVLRFLNGAEAAGDDILKFVRKAAGNLYEVEQINVGANLYPDALGFDLGSSASYWDYLHSIATRAKIGAGAAGLAGYMTYTGDAVADSSGGACTLGAQATGAGAINTGWIKLFSGATVYWVPYWETGIV